MERYQRTVLQISGMSDKSDSSHNQTLSTSSRINTCVDRLSATSQDQRYESASFCTFSTAKFMAGDDETLFIGELFFPQKTCFLNFCEVWRNTGVNSGWYLTLRWLGKNIPINLNSPLYFRLSYPLLLSWTTWLPLRLHICIPSVQISPTNMLEHCLCVNITGKISSLI